MAALEKTALENNVNIHLAFFVIHRLYHDRYVKTRSGIYRSGVGVVEGKALTDIELHKLLEECKELLTECLGYVGLLLTKGNLNDTL